MYKALYRKWRPLTFDDVISQEQVTETLKNQIISGKTGHAYLFTGSRGTGKTTCARIFAKAVNCPNSKDGSPCLECDICRDADSGALTDIIEMDAASNNGVSEIRDIRDEVNYFPERGKYKVYIIDEVHMLSINAFNALLKTLEEPPEHVKFILATTELDKVPATILSRCQRYDFRRIRPKDIAKRLKFIAAQEQLELTEDGAELIAVIADGGMRDAVSLLDQCAVTGGIIDAQKVSMISGIAGRDYIYDLLEAMDKGDTASALSITGSLYDMSKDLTKLCEDLINQLRNILLLRVSPNIAENMIICIPEELDRLRAMAERSDVQLIMERIELLQNGYDKMKRAMNKRVEFEMTLIRICGNLKNSAEGIDNSEIYDKIKQLEDKLNNLPKNGGAAPKEREVLSAAPPSNPDEPIPSVEIDPKKLAKDSSELEPVQRWDEIMKRFREVRPAMAGCLDGSRAGTKGNVLVIFTPNRFFIPLLRSDKDSAIALSRTIYDFLGKKYSLRGICTTSEAEQRNIAEQLLQKARNSSIETAVENGNH